MEVESLPLSTTTTTSSSTTASALVAFPSNCHSLFSITSCSSYEDEDKEESIDSNYSIEREITSSTKGSFNSGWLTSIAADWTLQTMGEEPEEKLPCSVLGGAIASETGLLEASNLLSPLESITMKLSSTVTALKSTVSESTLSSSSSPRLTLDEPILASGASQIGQLCTTASTMTKMMTVMKKEIRQLPNEFYELNGEVVPLSSCYSSGFSPSHSFGSVKEQQVKSDLVTKVEELPIEELPSEKPLVVSIERFPSEEFPGEKSLISPIKEPLITAVEELPSSPQAHVFTDKSLLWSTLEFDTPCRPLQFSNHSIKGFNTKETQHTSRPASPDIIKPNCPLNWVNRKYSHWNRQSALMMMMKNSRQQNLNLKRSFSEFIDCSHPHEISSDYEDDLMNCGGINTALPLNEITSCFVDPSIEYALPCHDSPRDAIKRINATTMTRLLAGEYTDLQVLIVDCRYPYEYHGGHLPGAINVCTMDEIEQRLFEKPESNCFAPTVIIFHCEFSSERAPRMALHVRNRDRMVNAHKYPFLLYPQLYILEGGYRAFFLQFPQHCDPPGHYVPMRTTDHRDELRYHQRLRHFGDGKHRHKLRSCSLKKSHSLAVPQPTTVGLPFYLMKAHEMAGASSMACDVVNSLTAATTTTMSTMPTMMTANTTAATIAGTNTMALLSSDIGDICEQSECAFLRSAESVLLTALDDGRASK